MYIKKYMKSCQKEKSSLICSEEAYRHEYSVCDLILKKDKLLHLST